MKGRETKGAPSADLLVCFPSRAHLTLMPKPICSPARPSEPNKRHHNHRHHHHHHPLIKKSRTRNGGGGRAGQASPLLWAKNKQMGSEITEPTSPKVTCAGQIKVRSKTSSCKSWRSVMKEIERVHNSRQHRKRPSWMESLGFKKEVMQFLTCLRSIRFDFRCFGSFPQSDITTDGEDEDVEDEEYQENHNRVDGNETSRTIFSKWFMVLQENQNNGLYKEEKKEKKEKERSHDVDDDQVAVPPPNALLLMRCRSAPAKSWLEENRVEQNVEDEENIENDEQEEEEEEEEECKRKDEKKTKNLRSLMEEENRKTKESLVVMKYDPDFYKISSDIAKETSLVGGMKDPLSRSRSWKR